MRVGLIDNRLYRCLLALVCWVAAGAAGSSHAQGLPAPPPFVPPAPAAEPSVEDRLRRLEESNQQLANQNRELMERYGELMRRHEEVLRQIETDDDDGVDDVDEDDVAEVMEALEVLQAREAESGGTGPLGAMTNRALRAEARGLESGAVGPRGEEGTDIGEGPERGEGPETEGKFSDFGVDYDNGFLIGPKDEDETPYLLKINARWQLRYFNFDRDRDFWWNGAGERLPIRNRSEFQTVRGRLSFEGFFHDPKLQYYFLINYTTNDENLLVAQNYWVNYEFSEAFNLYFGKNYVPGSREWLNGSTRMQFADRSLATAFFRPGRTTGLFAIGEPLEGAFYQVMIGDSFRNDNLGFPDIDSNLVYSGSTWFEPLGQYGRGYSDLEWHENLVARVGSSFTYSAQDGLRLPATRPIQEENFIRLSDGTELITPGALAPGVTVNQYDVYLWALDAAFKYRGFSLNGELYQRWLQGIRGDGPLPRSTIFDYGFFAGAGYFVIPDRIELMARTSQIWGEYGSGAEYAGGFNWFLKGSHYLKFTFDATRVVGSPAQAASPGYRAGDTGLMYRAQFQAAF